MLSCKINMTNTSKYSSLDFNLMLITQFWYRINKIRFFVKKKMNNFISQYIYI